MKTLLKTQNLKNIPNLHHSHWEEFLYATEKELYEPFFVLSQYLTSPHKQVFTKLTFHPKPCSLACSFCSLANPPQDQPLQFDQTLFNQIHSPSVILESSSIDPETFFTFQYTLKKMSQFSLYLDIGAENLLKFPQFLQNPQWQHFFIDYSPADPNLLSTLKIFKNTPQIYTLLSQFPQKSFYSNFIVDLPGQNFQNLIQDLFFLFQYPLKGIKITPFIPEYHTPFQIFSQACFLTTLKVISIVRILKPHWSIFVDEFVYRLQDHQHTIQRSLQVGANVISIPFNSCPLNLNLSPPPF